VNFLVDSLLNSYSELKNSIPIDPYCQFGKNDVIELTDKLRSLLFPGYFDDELTEVLLERVRRLLLRLLTSKKEQEHKEETAKLAMDFLTKLPKIRASLATDVEAAFDSDPAAIGKEEIIISYPGIYAISIYRLAHELYLFNIPMLPRIMTEYAHSVTGIDIHPGAQIGDYFFIDHGTGIVIGGTTVIGEHVKIYQGVTLGALSTKGGQRLRGKKRHPTVEDNVTIYAGASIFGGDTVIGKNSVLGSNVFVTESVPADSKLSINDKSMKKQKTSQKYWYYEI
jgi:serine O-acetyltransferase